MIINVKTLVDITETLTRKGPDTKLVKQQNNHDTLLQASSLRGNVQLLLQSPSHMRYWFDEHG